jgi:hypothetical protein
MIRRALQALRSSQRRRKVSKGPCAAALRRIIDTNIVFVHIPKCGGKSVVQQIYGIGEHEYFGHAGVEFYRALLGPYRFEKFFKFAVMRDPVSRCVSGFRFVERGGFGFKDDELRKKRIFGLNFEDFVTSGTLRDFSYNDVIFRPQVNSLMFSDQSLGIDRVVRFENIEKEIKSLPISRRTPEKLYHLNAAPTTLPLRLSNEVEAIIRDVYAQDYDFLEALRD